ncbi:hypothetical protein DET54_11010 [Paenibacillus pabuli]|uniref:Uncharacterized protein n=1 Tax=Paenibacillus pabuli TaxID=1472 RepID=A0ABX9BGT8_9BACL|nr:hypothetical protein [Paenibacillus pabuli]RAI92305.1 hypothetical protein DET54_11010 [Paenibacillus pabuli]
MRVRKNDALRGENLQYLFTILFILGFMAFFVFIVLMVLFIRKHNRISIRHVMLTAACFAIASIGMYGMLALPSNPTQSPLTQTNASGFHMTMEEFKNKFNGAVGKYRLNGLNITRLNMKDSPQQGTGAFEYVFNDTLRLAGTLNSGQKVQEVRLYETGDVSEATGGIFLTAIATLILTTNNEYTYNDAQAVIQDISILDRDVSQSNFDGATVRNGYEYRFSIQEDISTFAITTDE